MELLKELTPIAKLLHKAEHDEKPNFTQLQLGMQVLCAAPSDYEVLLSIMETRFKLPSLNLYGLKTAGFKNVSVGRVEDPTPEKKWKCERDDEYLCERCNEFSINLDNEKKCYNRACSLHCKRCHRVRETGLNKEGYCEAPANNSYVRMAFSKSPEPTTTFQPM